MTVRVLNITKSTGGLAGYNRTLLPALNAGERVHVHNICLSDQNVAYAEMMRDKGVPSTPMEMDRYAINITGDLQLARRLRRFLQEGNYDVIIGHGAKGGALARLVGRLESVPAVYVLHSMPFLTRVQGNKAYLYRPIEQVMGRLGGHIVAITYSQQKELVNHGIAAEENISVIHTGIEVDRFDERTDRTEACESLELDPSRPVVGWAARMEPQKAPLDFIRAVERVVTAVPDVQVYMAGEGNLKDEVMALARELGVEDSMIFAPWQSDVPRMLSAFDVYVMSSHWEGLPLSLLESLSIGNAAVAPSIDGIPEVIRPGVDGFLFQAGDHETMAAHTITLLQDADLRAKVQQAARDRVREAFTFEQMVRKWEDFLVDYAPVTA